jgi:hypothetical protein
VQVLKGIEARIAGTWSSDDPPEMSDCTVYNRRAGRVEYWGVGVRGIVTGH